MKVALILLAIQGAIGGFDTVYYHEWRARLPGLGRQARAELGLHAARSLIYAVMFGTLPWLQWQGALAWGLAGLLATEIVITMTDFVVEKRVRAPLGGVDAGERVTHAIMGIVYGGMLAYLLPEIWAWSEAPTGFRAEAVTLPPGLQWLLVAQAVGVAFSGMRDLAATLELPGAAWPWVGTWAPSRDA